MSILVLLFLLHPEDNCTGQGNPMVMNSRQKVQSNKLYDLASGLLSTIRDKQESDFVFSKPLSNRELDFVLKPVHSRILHGRESDAIVYTTGTIMFASWEYAQAVEWARRLGLSQDDVKIIKRN
jgi:hypothetical protein